MDVVKDNLIEELFNMDIILGKAMKMLSRKTPAMEGYAIAGTQLMTLITLKDQPPINMTQLSEVLGIPRQQLTKIIDALVSKKFVERYSDSGNRRIVLVKISQKGHAFLQQFFYHKRECLSKFVGILNDKQEKDFMEALITIKRIISEVSVNL